MPTKLTLHTPLVPDAVGREGQSLAMGCTWHQTPSRHHSICLHPHQSHEAASLFRWNQRGFTRGCTGVGLQTPALALPTAWALGLWGFAPSWCRNW